MNSSSSSLTPTRYFRRQRLQATVIFVALLVITLGAGALTRFEVADAFTAIPRVARWMATNLIPDAKAVERLPRILTTLWDTVLMSVMASVVAAVAALPFALLGSQTTKVNDTFATVARLVASVNRNIPVAAWALIFLLSFGQSSFTGFLALFFASFGFLTRVFIETIDETSAASVEALRATGASYFHIVSQAVMPASLPQLMSWELFTVETNIRSATLVGLLTGSGIGFLFDVYYKSLQYRSAAMVVIALVVVVLAIELISNVVRRRIL